MICRSCGAEIADKALICYRCGAATAEPRVPPPEYRRPRRHGPLPMVLALVVLIVLAVMLLPMTPSGSGARVAAWIAMVVAAVVIVWSLRPGRRR